MSVAGLIALSYWHPPDCWPTWQVAILAGGALALVYALQLILVTFPMWVVIVGGFSAAAAPFLVIATLANGSPDEVVQWAATGGLFYSPITWWIIVTGLAVVALRYAYYRWMTWELGKVAL
jgi:hypothetical protein